MRGRRRRRTRLGGGRGGRNRRGKCSRAKLGAAFVCSALCVWVVIFVWFYSGVTSNRGSGSAETGQPNLRAANAVSQTQEVNQPPVEANVPTHPKPLPSRQNPVVSTPPNELDSVHKRRHAADAPTNIKGSRYVDLARPHRPMLPATAAPVPPHLPPPPPPPPSIPTAPSVPTAPLATKAWVRT